MKFIISIFEIILQLLNYKKIIILKKIINKQKQKQKHNYTLQKKGLSQHFEKRWDSP